MRLHVGILSELPGWHLLLSQEGVSFSNIAGDIDADGYSVVVVGNDVTPQVVEQVRLYLNDGGSVLCSGKCYSLLSGRQPKRAYVKYLYPQRKSIFSKTEIIDIQKECLIPFESNELLTDTQHPALYAGPFGKGHLMVFPFDAGELILDERMTAKSFYAERSRLPFEQVSLVSKNGIRGLVSRSLEILHHKRGLPFVHRWYYPRNADNIFVFRIDTDKGSRDEIQNLYKLLSGNSQHKISASWFVDVKSQEQWLADYASMITQEIGVHCYEHKRYDDYFAAGEDIRNAAGVLDKASIRTKGFASPYGNWNSGISKAVEAQGFDYSSEFSYDYDSVPSFPYANDRFSGVVQIPVHPVSIGSLRRQGFSETEMKKYFQNVMEKKMSAHELLCFYHHPKDHCEPVLEEMFAWIRNHGIQNMTMGDYARWWKRRHTIRDVIQLNGSSLSVTTENKAEDVWLRITRPDGTATCVESTDTMMLEALQWKQVPVSQMFSTDMLRVRSYNPWVPLIRLQDRINSYFHRERK